VHVDTRLVLANAIYFKGKWEDRFHHSLTKEGEFYRLDGSTVTVSFMKAGRPPAERPFWREKEVRVFCSLL
jgi:serine protease inhibitor